MYIVCRSLSPLQSHFKPARTFCFDKLTNRIITLRLGTPVIIVTLNPYNKSKQSTLPIKKTLVIRFELLIKVAGVMITYPFRNPHGSHQTLKCSISVISGYDD